MSKMRARTFAYLISVVAFVGLSAWSCGGSKESSGTGNPSPTSSAPPAEAPGSPGGTATQASGSGDVSLAAGDAVFHQRCELCHGPNGMGDGPGGAALNPKPRNFHDKAVQDTLTDAWILRTIMNGKAGTGMPPWQGIVSESEAKSLVLKIRSFAK